MSTTRAGERSLSVLVKPDLEEIVRARAKANGRSITKELVALVQTGLAVESESVRETLRLLFLTGVEVEVTDEASPQPA